jgi:hypothetical protein
MKKETTKKESTKKESIKLKAKKTIFGITANIRNSLITVALLFGFISGFFQIYSWIDNTYARRAWVKQIELKGEFKWESDILNVMYSRYYILDGMVNLAPDPTKVPFEIRSEYNTLKDKIKLQEDKVKVLQSQMCKD